MTSWQSASVVQATAALLLISLFFTLFAWSQLSSFDPAAAAPLAPHLSLHPNHMDNLVSLYKAPKAYDFRLLRPKSIELDSKHIEKLGLAQGSSFQTLKEEVSVFTKNSAPKKVKTVYMIRHGEGNHNSAEEKFGKEQWEKVEALKDKYLDVSLNPTGIEQCERLQKSINKALETGLEVDVIVVSPLSRALETAAIAMDKVWNDVSVPKVAVEMSRERYGKNTCDKRRSVTELRQKWPMVDFDHFMNAEEDIWWTPVRETEEHVKTRAQHFYQWLMDTEWQSIVLVGHSSFMSNSYELLSRGGYHWPSNGELVPIVIEGSPV